MGGQQVIYKESALAKVDYVDAKVRELNTKIDAEFNSIKDSLKQMSTEPSEDINNRLIALDAKFNMLQEMFCKISSQTRTATPPVVETPSKTATPKWLNARELLATLKDKKLEAVPLAQLSSMLIWANLITREGKAKNGSHYKYALTKYGEEQNIVSVVGDHKHILQYNPVKVEDLARLIVEYKDWYNGSRRA